MRMGAGPEEGVGGSERQEEEGVEEMGALPGAAEAGRPKPPKEEAGGAAAEC